MPHILLNFSLFIELSGCIIMTSFLFNRTALENYTRKQSHSNRCNARCSCIFGNVIKATSNDKSWPKNSLALEWESRLVLFLKNIAGIGNTVNGDYTGFFVVAVLITICLHTRRFIRGHICCFITILLFHWKPMVRQRPKNPLNYLFFFFFSLHFLAVQYAVRIRWIDCIARDSVELWQAVNDTNRTLFYSVLIGDKMWTSNIRLFCPISHFPAMERDLRLGMQTDIGNWACGHLVWRQHIRLTEERERSKVVGRGEGAGVTALIQVKGGHWSLFIIYEYYSHPLFSS